MPRIRFILESDFFRENSKPGNGTESGRDFWKEKEASVGKASRLRVIYLIGRKECKEDGRDAGQISHEEKKIGNSSRIEKLSDRSEQRSNLGIDSCRKRLRYDQCSYGTPHSVGS